MKAEGERYPWGRMLTLAALEIVAWLVIGVAVLDAAPVNPFWLVAAFFLGRHLGAMRKALDMNAEGFNRTLERIIARVDVEKIREENGRLQSALAREELARMELERTKG